MKNSHSRSLAAILGFLVIPIVLVPEAAALMDYLEDFEDDSIPNNPDADFYNFGVTGTGTSAVVSNPALGTKAYKLASSGTSQDIFAKFTWQNDIDGCDVQQKFAFQIQGFGDSDTDLRFQFENDGSGGSTMDILTMGVIRFNGAADAVTTINLNQWYNLTVSHNCPIGSSSFFLADQSEVVNVDAAPSFVEPMNVFEMRAEDGGKVILDNLEIVNAPDFAPTLGEFASVSVTGLTGFDVDDTGAVVIARTANGASIQTWDGLTLQPLGSTSTSGCNIANGVVATGTHVAYLDCTGGDTITNLRVRSPSLTAPDFGDCDPDACSADIGTEDIPNFPDFSEITDIEAFPVGQTSRDFLFGGGLDPINEVSYLAWGFSTNTGRIGVAAKTIREDFDDAGDDDFVIYGPETQTPIQVVTFVGSNGNMYLTGAQTGATTKVYRFTLTKTGSTGETRELVVDVIDTPALIGTSAYNGLSGIECAVDQCVFYKATGPTVGVFNRTTGALAWGPRSITGVGNRQVAMSGNGQYVAYANDAHVYIAGATNGTVACRLPIPTGTFKDVEFSQSAQVVHIATQTNIFGYALAENGCTPTLAEEVGEPEPSPDTDGFFNISPTTIPGAGTFGANLFFGVIMVAGMTVTLGTAPNALSSIRSRGFTFSVVLAVIGAILGFLMAWGFGLFNTETVVTIIVLSVVAILARAYFGRGD